MYIISARKGDCTFVKGYDLKIICILMAMYYKLQGYEVNYGDD